MDNENKMQKYDFPMIPLRGMTVLPGMIVHFDVSRKKSMKAIDQAMLEGQRVFLVTQKNPGDSEPLQEDLYEAGVIARVSQFLRTPDSTMRVLVKVEKKALLQEVIEDGEYLRVSVTEQEIKNDLEKTVSEAMIRVIKDLVVRYISVKGDFNADIARTINDAKELENLIMLTANYLPFYYEQKQQILEATDIESAYEYVVHFLSQEIDINELKNRLKKKVKTAVEQNQKEYYLREEIKAIKSELGEDDVESDSEEYMKAAKKLKAPKNVKDKLFKEIKRFNSMSPNSSESSVQRAYIETLLELPWDKSSKDKNDIVQAEEILNKDHYGLDKVKERAIEYLAVRQHTKSKSKGSVICLVGPPGTGKTSIAKSLAKATGKEYVRICLGGVRDEAEIRGHRKTYVGAMPGRIVKAIKQAGVSNPLILLDEIDKLGSDYKGDPSSALLEVLDGEQNSRFRDHYLELPLDLSKVLFIATANSTDTIPGPLLDRLEIIEVTSYTSNEKEHIAKDYLIKKQREEHGLTAKQFSMNKKSIQIIIESYTKEAGVRQLERTIGKLCRKVTKEIVESKAKSVKITEENIKDYLGKPKYTTDMVNVNDEIGIVRGLAWTSVGGDTLEIEVNVMPGKGELKLTGKLGDVMKESAMTALSYVRMAAKEYDVNASFFTENDIHIHVPEGAVPKDGPSAGITMATAILSAVTNLPVRAEVAMTGEITLRGRVLPIGGLKEKMLAAKKAGIKTVLVPAKNKADVEEISAEIKRGIKVNYVSKMEEVLSYALAR